MEHWEIISNGQIVVDRNAEELWENMCSYFRFCDENPIIVKRTVTSGKGVGNKVGVELKRPYTIKAMCLHCGISESYINDIRQTKSKDDLYYIAVERAMYIIFNQNVEHAMVGEFNPIFTAKLLNLDDNESETSAIKVEIVHGTPELANSENEILEKLDSEWEKIKKGKGKID